MARKHEAKPTSVAEVHPKSPGQAVYTKSLRRSIITICSGPAGTGKTFLACHAAVELLAQRKVEKIILVRPLVSCGKDVGTLPGELEDKIGPYMRPLMDAFSEFFPPGQLDTLMGKKVVVMEPLEFLRGSTLKHSFVILDEAQNSTYPQLHMLLTRLGCETRMAIVGDASQDDLGSYGPNPLSDVIRKFRNDCHSDISICYLGREDIQRHPLIQWMDERLGPQPVEQEGPTQSSIHCTECNKRAYYSLNDAGGFPVEQIQCWNCNAVLDMGDDVVEMTDIKIPMCQKTFANYQES